MTTTTIRQPISGEQLLAALPDPAAVLLIGISGSGKSTLAARLWEPGQILSLDAMRAKVSGDPNDQDATADAIWELERALHTRLARGETTVIDATSLTVDHRALLLQHPMRFGIAVHAVVVDTPFDVAAARNAARPGPAAGARWGRRVPDDVLADQARLLAAQPPALFEGFAAIHTVLGHRAAEPSLLAPIASGQITGTVTVSGIAADLTLRTTNQDNPYATFALADAVTGLRVVVPPLVYRRHGEAIELIGLHDHWADDDCCPGLTVTVTGRAGRAGPLPVLHATALTVDELSPQRAAEQAVHPLVDGDPADGYSELLWRAAEWLRFCPRDPRLLQEAESVQDLRLIAAMFRTADSLADLLILCSEQMDTVGVKEAHDKKSGLLHLEADDGEDTEVPAWSCAVEIARDVLNRDVLNEAEEAVR